MAGLIADAWPDDKSQLERARRLAELNRNSVNPALLDTLGWVEYRLGNNDDAVGLLERAAAANGHDPQIRYHLGLAYLARNSRSQAITELKIATDATAPYRGLDNARRALASD